VLLADTRTSLNSIVATFGVLIKIYHYSHAGNRKGKGRGMADVRLAESK
jgi:hypothetical protein